MSRRSVVRKNRCPSMETLERRLQMSLSINAPINYPAGVSPVTFALSDLSNNGRSDIVTAAGSLVSVQIATNTGAFGSAQTYVVGSNVEDIIAAQLTNNGTMDLVTANSGSDNVSVLMGNGDGTFKPAVNFSVGSGVVPTQVVAADFTSHDNGTLDILTADKNDLLSLLVGDGTGNFGAAQTITGGVAASEGYVSIATADLTGDGHMDFIGVDGSGQSVAVRLGSGHGTFGSAIATPVASAHNSPVGVVAAVMATDTLPDIITADYGDKEITVLHSNGDGTFSVQGNYSTGTTQANSFPALAVTVGDVNGDGINDIVIAEYGQGESGAFGQSGQIGVLLGNSNGTFQPAQNLVTPNGITFVGVGDVNGDGKPDLVATHTYTNVGVFLGTWPAVGATHLVITQQPTNQQAGNTDSMVVNIENAQNQIVTTDDENVTLTFNTNPTGATIGGTAVVAAVNGVATFNDVVLDTAGQYELTATSAFIASTTSDLFTVNPGPASQLGFIQEPGTTTAGVAISPALVVQVEDQFGNAVSNSSDITLGIASGPTGAVLNGTLSTNAVNGTAAFSDVVLNTAGTYTLSATAGSFTGTSSSFVINTAAPSQLVISQPPTATTAGTDISTVVVNVEDQFGNVVTGNTSNVTVALQGAPSGAVLNGSLTIAAVNGEATFSNLVLNTAGTFGLLFSDTGLTSASGGVTITPGADAQLVYGVQPANTAIGSAVPIVVDVEDQFGNIVTTDSSQVTLKPKILPTGGTFNNVSVNAVNGVATFSGLVFDTPGGYKFKAADGSLLNVKSNKFFMGAGSELALAAGPGNTTAGTAITPNIVVDVEDQWGQLVTIDDSTVTLKPRILPTGVTFNPIRVQASNGVATFPPVTFDIAGQYRLKAADGSLSNVKTSRFQITPAAASQVVFSQGPTNVDVDAAITPPIQVDVEDAFGNIVTSDTSDVLLSIDTGPGGANLGGGGPVAASGGVAVFSDVTLDTVGAYQLQASDGSLVTALSAPFNVS
jgi:FG-GAP-like repeat